MWVKTYQGDLINLDWASAIWAGDSIDVTKFGGDFNEYDVEVRLNIGGRELIDTLDSFHTKKAAQQAVDAIGKALSKNCSFFNMMEISKEE